MTLLKDIAAGIAGSIASIRLESGRECKVTIGTITEGMGDTATIRMAIQEPGGETVNAKVTVELV